jgi:hypothetical protein
LVPVVNSTNQADKGSSLVVKVVVSSIHFGCSRKGRSGTSSSGMVKVLVGTALSSSDLGKVHITGSDSKRVK